MGLFEGGDDNAAEDDALAEDEDDEDGDGGNNDGRHDHEIAVGLQELVEEDHESPHGLVLADEEGKHEGAEGHDGENGHEERERDAPEHGPLGSAVNQRGFIEFGREAIEEDFEEKDAEAIGEAGQDECAEGVEEAEIADHEKIRDHADFGGEGHGGEKEVKGVVLGIVRAAMVWRIELEVDCKRNRSV